MKDGKVLTNIAYIEEEEKEDGTVVTIKKEKIETQFQVQNQKETKIIYQIMKEMENKEDLTDKNYYYKGQEDDDDFEKLIVAEKTGNYSLQIEKVDSNDNNVKLQDAEFSVSGK